MPPLFKSIFGETAVAQTQARAVEWVLQAFRFREEPIPDPRLGLSRGVLLTILKPDPSSIPSGAVSSSFAISSAPPKKKLDTSQRDAIIPPV